LGQYGLVLLSLTHHLVEIFVQLYHPVSILFLFREGGSIGTLGLLGRVSLVPGPIALIAKLALTEALHVRTAHFLFDWLPALGALARVIADPVGIGLFRVD
jgi:hypothetical protein